MRIAVVINTAPQWEADLYVGALEAVGFEVISIPHEQYRTLETLNVRAVVLLGLSRDHRAGIEFLGELRQLAKEVSLVVLSGHAADDVIADVTAAGARAFFSKPISLQEFATAVKALCEPH